MEFQFEKEVRSDKEGLDQLAKLEEKSRELRSETLKLDFTQTNFFDAHLCSGLGAVLTQVDKNSNKIQFEFGTEESKIENTLKRNAFMYPFGRGFLPDRYGTTIKYKKFKADKPLEFKEYLTKHLFNLKDMPEMTEGSKKQIFKSLIEVFNNPSLHAGCDHVFACGQYYPNEKHIDFCIANLGRTIHENVKDYLGSDFSKIIDIKSLNTPIWWAIQEGNTTRRGLHPGGFGLSVLKKFLGKTGGRLQICSKNEFWQEYWDIEPSAKRVSHLSSSIKGTIVILRFQVTNS
ncbi:MAG: hypothetical protein OXJ52_03045 [Oligoflexia bacterium]|nr:hypothetical protein [Oligoflexia bacterium]